MAYFMPPPYPDAVRAGLTYFYTVDATVGGVPVAGATGLRPAGGSITDTTKPGVRRALSLELASTPGLYDLLRPFGTTLTVTANIVYTSRATAQLPMGVFDVDQASLSEGGGKITLTAPDKWVRVQRANFVAPASSIPGATVVGMITRLVQDALGASEPVLVSATSTATVGAMTWDPSQTSRAQAIQDLAAGIGAWVFFDRNGVCHIDDVPVAKSAADWLIDASASGVLVSLDRSRDRTHTYNVVSISSSASSGETFPTLWVWDNDSNSPTYAGPDPIGSPGSAGPFGAVIYHFSTPLVLDSGGARATALSILAQTTGLSSGANLGSVPNPAIDAFDALDVLGPGRPKPVIIGHTPQVVTTVTTPGVSALFPGSSTYPGASAFPSVGTGGGTTTVVTDPGGAPIVTIGSSGAVAERHVVDVVTHPLDVTQPTTVQGRSTRTDAYT